MDRWEGGPALEARLNGVVGFGGIFASWRKVVYGVSFAAAAATASSPSEFRGVMRGDSVAVPLVFGLVVGFRSNPGTGVRRKAMVGIGKGR